MTAPNWFPLARNHAVHELSREDGSGLSAADRRMRENGIKDTNVLSEREAVSLVRAIRLRVRREPPIDSTGLIRADRDGR